MNEVVRAPWARQRKPRESQFNEKREAVLQQAATLFASKGFAAVSLNSVAECLNITKPTLYYYFKSKDEMLLEIKRRAQTRIFEAIDEACEVEGTGLQKLEVLLDKYLDVVASDFGRCLMTVNPVSLEPGSRRKIEGRAKEAEDRILELIELGMKDRSIRQQDVKVAYHGLFGIVNWTAVWYKDRGPANRAKVTRQIISLLFDGIRGPNG